MEFDGSLFNFLTCSPKPVRKTCCPCIHQTSSLTHPLMKLIPISVPLTLHFENGDEYDGDVNQSKKKYAKTLEVLTKCVEMDDYFNGVFSNKYMEQLLWLKELHKQKNKPWKTVSSVIFVTALASVLVLSLVAAEHESPA